MDGILSSSLVTKLYSKHSTCLHVDSYLIHNGIQPICGPCYFRDGVIDEVPTRITMHEESGLFGSPQFDPRFLTHLELSMGLIPPEQGESLRRFKQRRQRISRPSQKLYPFTSALWHLMGVQPPLARALLLFCAGYSEVQIAYKMNVSVFNVQDRLRKAAHTGRKFLKVDNGSLT